MGGSYLCDCLSGYKGEQCKYPSDADCKLAEDLRGLKYQGTHNVANNGQTCRDWNLHFGQDDSGKIEEMVNAEGNHNYCSLNTNGGDCFSIGILGCGCIDNNDMDT